MGIFALITACVVAGLFVLTTVALTMKWVISRVKERIAHGKVKKVLFASIGALAAECDNQMDLEKLNELVGQGCTYIEADITSDGSVGEITGIRDKNQSLDEEVAALLGRRETVILGE